MHVTISNYLLSNAHDDQPAKELQFAGHLAACSQINDVRVKNIGHVLFYGVHYAGGERCLPGANHLLAVHHAEGYPTIVNCLTNFLWILLKGETGIRLEIANIYLTIGEEKWSFEEVCCDF